ncbi:MAG: V-type ATP synthase subunit K [Sulfolobales archaeon]
MALRAQGRMQFDVLVATSVIILLVGLVLIFVAIVSGGGGLSFQAVAPAELGKLGKYIGAGLAMGLAAIGAGLAIGIAGAAGFSAMAEKPELFGRVFLIIVLAEGLGIYGLIIAILLILLG